jgi:hypothetical protein
MRLPRVRFTVRRMLVALGVAASAMGAARLHGDAVRFRARAALHARLQVRCAALADEYEAIYLRTADGYVLRDAPRVRVPIRSGAEGEPLQTSASWDDPAWAGADARTKAPHDAAGWRREASRHADLKAKYERAARYPWLPVPADPPEPR